VSNTNRTGILCLGAFGGPVQMLSTTGNSERADSAANQRQGRRKSIGNGRSGRVDFAPFAL